MQLNVKSDRIWSFYLLNVQRLSPLLQTPGPVCVCVWLKIIKLEWFWESKKKVSQKCNLFRMAKHFHCIRLTGPDTSSVRPFDFHRNNSFNCSFHIEKNTQKPLRMDSARTTKVFPLNGENSSKNVNMHCACIWTIENIKTVSWFSFTQKPHVHRQLLSLQCLENDILTSQRQEKFLA